jgi:glycosyltransferase involved in cell wall biosynthesis
MFKIFTNLLGGAMKGTPEKPAASVIMPIFNAEKYVDAAIEAILSQDFDDFELLLLNDGSTDGTLQRLEHFALRDDRCKIYSWPNRGIIATRNEGVRLSISNLLICVDADDICRPGRFSKQVAYMAKHPECVALGSRMMLIDAEGWPIAEVLGKELDHDSIDAAHLAGMGGSLPQPAAIIRKDAFVKVGGYLEDYPHAEDIDLFLRLAEIGRLANLNEVLLDYRQHLSSIGYSHRFLQKQSAHRAVVDAYNRRGLGHPILRAPSQSDELPSLADVHRKWGWWALGAGNLKTARKHAWQALTLTPFERENLRLCACVLRGY